MENDYIDIGIILFGLIVSVFLGIKYLRYWQQVKKAMLESGAGWPLPSQKELNETTRKDLLKGYGMIGKGVGQAARILFTMKTDNPLIAKPLRGMRRTLITFILFPFLLAFIAVTIYVFSAV